jgi:hypothetical protein
MAKCGEYELDRAIGWGRRATYFSARANGGGEVSFVIRRARSGERACSQAFLRAAAEQQAAVVAGCRRLAPIHAFECDESGFAYYATARYETSLAEFLEAGCKVDSALLREIATSVLGALAELQEKSRRAHGNLTPGNILLDPHGRIFLTDLAHSAKDATTADDLFALGTLIYQLVRRTARIGMLNPPLDYSPEWTESLGDDADGWLAFTNRLLAKSRNTSPDAIKSALGDLKSLASLAAKAAASPQESGQGAAQGAVRRPPKKKRSPLPAVLAIILLLGSGAGGYLWWKSKEEEKKRQIEIALERKRQEERDKALPPSLQNLRAEIKQLPAKINKDGTLRSRLLRIVNDLGGTWNKDDINRGLNKEWELPDKMKARALPWRSAPREWTRLAGELDAASQIDVEEETPIIRQLLRTIAADEAAAELDQQWKNITGVLRELAAENNKLLPDFTPWAASEIRGARDLADASSRAAGALKTLGDVRDFQKDKWARVVQARFETDAAEILKVPGDDLMPGWPGRWKREAERLVGPTDEKRAEWNRILGEAKSRIPKLPPKDQQKWKDEVAKANAEIETALDENVAAIDKSLTVFNGMRLQIEIVHEQYAAFLNGGPGTPGWSERAAGATKENADALLEEFRVQAEKLLSDYKADPRSRDYVAAIQSAVLVKRMGDALKTPDKVTVDLPGWKTDGANDKVALCTFTKGNEKVQMPFIALDDTGYAMAAWETPLILARLSGAPRPAPPKDRGPQTRSAEGFVAMQDWLWKQPRELKDKQDRSIPYFTGGNQPGDTGNDYCPVTWITFDEASAIAGALGGELPTADQWKAASKIGEGKEKRLRGSAWTSQYAQLAIWRDLTGNIQNDSGPDIGSFSKQSGLASGDYQTNSSADKDATSDGRLWLRSVKPTGGWGAASGFTHLVGNAAEWVKDNDKHAIIGGSVVSPPTLPTRSPLPVSEGSYFDVTFRLVIKIKPGGADFGLSEFKRIAAGIQVPPAPAPQ